MIWGTPDGALEAVYVEFPPGVEAGAPAGEWIFLDSIPGDFVVDRAEIGPRNAATPRMEDMMEWFSASGEEEQWSESGESGRRSVGSLAVEVGSSQGSVDEFESESER